MIGWLGAAYPWVKAAHVIFAIFWIAGMFMLPRFLAYHSQSAVGSPEDAAWVERERRLIRIIINPAMIMVWLLGLSLAANIGFGQGWLIAKMTVVLALSAYHGWLSAARKAFARGERPYSEKTLRLLNEVPGIATIAIVILVIVRPF